MAAGIDQNPQRGFPQGIAQQDPIYNFKSAGLQVDEVTRSYDLCLGCEGKLSKSQTIVEHNHGRYHQSELCEMLIRDNNICGACQKIIRTSSLPTLHEKAINHSRLGYIHSERGCLELADRITQLLDPNNNPDIHTEFQEQNVVNLDGNTKDYILRRPIAVQDGEGTHIQPGIKIENHQKKHALTWIGHAPSKPSGTTFFPSWNKDKYIQVFNQVVDSPEIQRVLQRIPLMVKAGVGARIQETVIIDRNEAGIEKFTYAIQGKKDSAPLCEAIEVQLAYGGYNSDGEFFWNIHMYPHNPNR